MIDFTLKEIKELYRMIDPQDPTDNPNFYCVRGLHNDGRSMLPIPYEPNDIVVENNDELLRYAISFISWGNELDRFFNIVHLPLSDMPLYINADDNSKIIARWRLKISK